GGQPVVAFQNGERQALIDADQQHGAMFVMHTQAIAERLDLADKGAGAAVKSALANAAHDVAEQEGVTGDLAPVGPRKNAHVGQIGQLELHLPPLRIDGKFAPHVSAAAEQQGTTDGIVAIVGEVGIEHDPLEQMAIVAKFLVVELILQEFRDHFRFADRTQALHAASCAVSERMRKNGIDTATSKITIKTICTITTSRKVA